MCLYGVSLLLILLSLETASMGHGRSPLPLLSSTSISLSAHLRFSQPQIIHFALSHLPGPSRTHTQHNTTHTHTKMCYDAKQASKLCKARLLAEGIIRWKSWNSTAIVVRVRTALWLVHSRASVTWKSASPSPILRLLSPKEQRKHNQH